jgi:hypothetical protein
VVTWLSGDDTRVRQALLNYAGNAVKFTARGHITLRARLEQAHDAKLLVRFEVEDTGIGVDPQQVAPLFQAFEQADASTTRAHGGTGLGLAITRRLAELMDSNAGTRPRPGGAASSGSRLGWGRAPALPCPRPRLQGLMPCCGSATPALEQVPSIGPLTASALVATAGDAKNFDNGRHFAAWLGLVPKQHSSGGKATLLGMSKRGDSYLRTLLIHGARSNTVQLSPSGPTHVRAGSKVSLLRTRTTE